MSVNEPSQNCRSERWRIFEPFYKCLFIKRYLNSIQLLPHRFFLHFSARQDLCLSSPVASGIDLMRIEKKTLVLDQSLGADFQGHKQDLKSDFLPGSLHCSRDNGVNWLWKKQISELAYSSQQGVWLTPSVSCGGFVVACLWSNTLKSDRTRTDSILLPLLFHLSFYLCPDECCCLWLCRINGLANMHNHFLE